MSRAELDFWCVSAKDWVHPQAVRTLAPPPQAGRHSHLQRIWLSKADVGSPLDAGPQVINLGGNMAEGQVADHHLLLHLRRLDAPGLAAIPCCPCDLEDGSRPAVSRSNLGRACSEATLGAWAASWGPTVLPSWAPLQEAPKDRPSSPPTPFPLLDPVWTTDNLVLQGQDHCPDPPSDPRLGPCPTLS